MLRSSNPHGLVLAATLAASRTASGKVGNRQEIEAGLNYDYTDRGCSGVKILPSL